MDHFWSYIGCWPIADPNADGIRPAWPERNFRSPSATAFAKQVGSASAKTQTEPRKGRRKCQESDHGAIRRQVKAKISNDLCPLGSPPAVNLQMHGSEPTGAHHRKQFASHGGMLPKKLQARSIPWLPLPSVSGTDPLHDFLRSWIESIGRFSRRHLADQKMAKLYIHQTKDCRNWMISSWFILLPEHLKW